MTQPKTPEAPGPQPGRQRRCWSRSRSACSAWRSGRTGSRSASVLEPTARRPAVRARRSLVYMAGIVALVPPLVRAGPGDRAAGSRSAPAFLLGFIGNVFNLVIPGAVGGDLIKAAYLVRMDINRTQAVASMVIDRILGLLGLFLLAGVAGRVAWPLATPTGPAC